MLTLMLPEIDGHDAVEVELEHSLVSLSKWEAKHQKAFFGHARETKTEAEMADYFNNMVVSPKSFKEDIVSRLSEQQVAEIGEYINSKQSATWFNEDPNQRKSTEVVTSELVYYWMISFQIPFECENWHFNRLMTLIRICGIKQTKPKRMSKTAQMEQYARLNAERRRKLGTSG